MKKHSACRGCRLHCSSWFAPPHTLSPGMLTTPETAKAKEFYHHTDACLSEPDIWKDNAIK